MKNVFDIKRDNNLNYILPTTSFLGEVNLEQHKIVVVIHLYYEDTIYDYMHYVKNIPEEIDVIFTISDEKIQEHIERDVQGVRKKYRFIKKENRGRDISAFLVACRELILDYDYVCFVHDKKEKTKRRYIDNKLWVKCLWENTIGSEDYIKNVIFTFQHNKELGVMVPPPPMSDDRIIAYTDRWEDNFENMVSLSKELNLDCDLEVTKSPITIGTAFWARVSAVKKLFEKKWDYLDFPQEPLPSDGTISHAIERSFAYVAQDAGFATGWVMTDRYAAERIEYMSSVLEAAGFVLDKYLSVRRVAKLKHFDRDVETIKRFAKDNSKIYIYGAGKFAQEYRSILLLLRRSPELYIVTKKGVDSESIDGVPVLSLEEVDFSDNPGVIIGVGENYQEEVVAQLRLFVGQEYKNILILE